MNPLASMLVIGALAATLLPQDKPQSETATKVCHMRGRAIDEDGKPIAGACLSQGDIDSATTVGAMQAPMTRSDAEGRFDLSFQAADNSPGNQQAVLIAAPGRLSAQLQTQSTWWNAPATDQVFDLGDVALPRGVTLRGSVREKNGSPRAGARVVAVDVLQALTLNHWGMNANVFYSASTITDDKGSFELPGVAASGARLVVVADGYYRRRLPFVTRGDSIVVELQAGGFVEGQVKGADGKPCAADIWLYYEVEEPQLVTTSATRDGNFRMNLCHPHRYRVCAFSGPSGHEQSVSAVLDGPSRGVQLRAVEAEATGAAEAAVVVRFVDATTGKAVEDVNAATVWQQNDVSVDERYSQFRIGSLAAKGKQPGELRLPGPKEGDPDTGIVIIRARGYAPMTLRGVQWSADAPPHLEARLVRESVITGTVVEEVSHQPVVGASVLLGELPDDQPLWFMGLPDAHSGGRVTDRDGRFRADGLEAGKHKIRAFLFGRASAEPIEVEVTAGEVRAQVQLVLPRGATLAGRLLGLEPLVGSQVQLRQRHKEDGRVHVANEDRMSARRAPLAADGAFTFHGLDRGDYEVELLVPHRQGRGGWLTLSIEPIRIRRSDLHRDFDASESQLGRIRGKVSLMGAPIQYDHLFIVAFPDQGPDSDEPWNGPSICEPLTADGSFDLPVAPGRQRIELLDAATNIALAVKAGLQVKPGGIVVADLKQELVRVHVILKPDHEGGQVVASRLEVVVQHDRGTNDAQFPDDGPVETAAGVSLAEGRTEFELVLPPLPTKLRVRTNASMVLADGAVSSDGPLAEREITPAKGKEERVEIKVPAAPNAPQK